MYLGKIPIISTESFRQKRNNLLNRASYSLHAETIVSSLSRNFSPVKARSDKEKAAAIAAAVAGASIFPGTWDFPFFLSFSLFFFNLSPLLFDAQYICRQLFIDTHSLCRGPIHFICILYYLSPSKFCALFSKTVQLITTTSSSPFSSRPPTPWQPRIPNLTPTLLLFPRTPPPTPPPPSARWHLFDRSFRTTLPRIVYGRSSIPRRFSR